MNNFQYQTNSSCKTNTQEIRKLYLPTNKIKIKQQNNQKQKRHPTPLQSIKLNFPLLQPTSIFQINNHNQGTTNQNNLDNNKQFDIFTFLRNQKLQQLTDPLSLLNASPSQFVVEKKKKSQGIRIKRCLTQLPPQNNANREWIELPMGLFTEKNSQFRYDLFGSNLEPILEVDSSRDEQIEKPMKDKSLIKLVKSNKQQIKHKQFKILNDSSTRLL